MRAKGISYDTGFVRNGSYSRSRFDPKEVERELRIIRDDLHCNAVRIMGGDPDRIELAAGLAADLGLEVWYSPYPLELAADELLALFADCAERAERLRRRGAEVVFVTGAELSLMNPGFLPGDTTDERIALLSRPEARPRTPRTGQRPGQRVPRPGRDHRPRTLRRTRHLRRRTTGARRLDALRPHLPRPLPLRRDRRPVRRRRPRPGLAGKARRHHRVRLRRLRGAGDRGALGLDIVEYDAEGPVRLKAAYERDEAGQAAYLRELLEAFDAGGIDATFVFTFALYDHVHRPDADPRDDLDLASYGIVKVYEDRPGTTYPDLPWDPKAAFTTLATYHHTH